MQPYQCSVFFALNSPAVSDYWGKSGHLERIWLLCETIRQEKENARVKLL